jgi:hypothetical protein
MKYDDEKLADNKDCAGVRADLKMCLLQSDCCKIVSFYYFEFSALSQSGIDIF